MARRSRGLARRSRGAGALVDLLLGGAADASDAALSALELGLATLAVQLSDLVVHANTLVVTLLEASGLLLLAADASGARAALDGSEASGASLLLHADTLELLAGVRGPLPAANTLRAVALLDVGVTSRAFLLGHADAVVELAGVLLGLDAALAGGARADLGSSVASGAGSLLHAHTVRSLAGVLSLLAGDTTSQTLGARAHVELAGALRLRNALAGLAISHANVARRRGRGRGSYGDTNENPPNNSKGARRSVGNERSAVRKAHCA